MNVLDSSGANNGQIQSQQDVSGPSGETITYAYDSLKRLSSATSSFTNQQAWSQNYGYDGFGNLVTKLGTGMAQNTSYPTDSTKNWLWNGQHDLNGNQMWHNALLSKTFIVE